MRKCVRAAVSAEDPDRYRNPTDRSAKWQGSDRRLPRQLIPPVLTNGRLTDSVAEPTHNNYCPPIGGGRTREDDRSVRFVSQMGHAPTDR